MISSEDICVALNPMTCPQMQTDMKQPEVQLDTIENLYCKLRHNVIPGPLIMPSAMSSMWKKKRLAPTVQPTCVQRVVPHTTNCAHSMTRCAAQWNFTWLLYKANQKIL